MTKFIYLFQLEVSGPSLPFAFLSELFKMSKLFRPLSIAGSLLVACLTAAALKHRRVLPLSEEGLLGLDHISDVLDAFIVEECFVEVL